MARNARPTPWSIRAFRALLSLYPGEFRDEYGREMAMVFADRYRDAPNAFERALVWLEALSGVLREAPKEHVFMILQDLRFAARILRRSPALTLTAVLTLALGIGANTAVFQLINAVTMRSLPVKDPGELAEVRIAGGNKGFGITNGPYAQLTRPVWEELAIHQEAFSGAFAWASNERRVGEGSELRRVRGMTVSGEFFSVLGVQAFRGRLFERADEASACPEPAGGDQPRVLAARAGRPGARPRRADHRRSRAPGNHRRHASRVLRHGRRRELRHRAAVLPPEDAAP